MLALVKSCSVFLSSRLSPRGSSGISREGTHYVAGRIQAAMRGLSASSASSSTSSSLATTSLHLSGRHYISVAGIDRLRLLQGLCTSDVARIAPGACQPSAFLNSKGRIMVDSLIHRCELDGEEVFVVETDSSSSQTLTQLLTVYKLRSRVKIAAKKLESYEILHLPENEAKSRLESTSGNSKILSSCRDVRFGNTSAWRVLVSRGPAATTDDASPAPPLPAFSSLSPEQSGVRYESLRLLSGVPEGADLLGRIPLECDLDELKYVDFEKGCYMGQELTARTKYKGIVKKRILPFLYSLSGDGYKNATENMSEFSYLKESEDALHSKVESADHPFSEELNETKSAAASSGSEDSASVSVVAGNITSIASGGVIGSVIGSPAYYPSLGFGVGLAMIRLEQVLNTASFAQGFLFHSRLGKEASGGGLGGLRCVPFRPRWLSDSVLAEAKK